MQLNKETIASHLPHGPSMVLLDHIINHDSNTIEALVNSHRNSDHPLRLNGRLGASASVELAAQAIAVHAQLHSKHTTPSTPARSGKIASIRKVSLYKRYLDDVAGHLVVFAQRIHGDENALLYTFKIEGGGVEIAQGTIAIHLH